MFSNGYTGVVYSWEKYLRSKIMFSSPKEHTLTLPHATDVDIDHQAEALFFRILHHTLKLPTLIMDSFKGSHYV